MSLRFQTWIRPIDAFHKKNSIKPPSIKIFQSTDFQTYKTMNSLKNRIQKAWPSPQFFVSSWCLLKAIIHSTSIANCRKSVRAGYSCSYFYIRFSIFFEYEMDILFNKTISGLKNVEDYISPIPLGEKVGVGT